MEGIGETLRRGENQGRRDLRNHPKKKGKGAGSRFPSSKGESHQQIILKLIGKVRKKEKKGALARLCGGGKFNTKGVYASKNRNRQGGTQGREGGHSAARHCPTSTS